MSSRSKNEPISLNFSNKNKEDQLWDNGSYTQINYNKSDKRKTEGNITKIDVNIASQLREENFLLREIIKDKEIIIFDKERIIRILNQKIELLNEKVQNLPKKTLTEDNYTAIMNNLIKINEKINILETKKPEHVLSYAKVASKTVISPTTNTPGQTLLIKPRKHQEMSTTKKDLHKNINLTELKIGINSIKNVKNGGMEIKCKNKEDVRKLEEEIKKKVTQYDVQIKELLNPKIKISGLKLENNMSEKDIENMIRQQNNFIKEDDKLIIHHIRYNEQKRSYMLFAEINASLFKKNFNQNHGKLFIAWQYLDVYENNQITRCYNCCRYNHKNKNCKNKTVCPYCSGEHSIENCRKKEDEKKCINCEFANAKYKTRHCTKHLANDNECPTYRYYQNKLVSQINYA